jgi:mono/diheme cytochrome c family protein
MFKGIIVGVAGTLITALLGAYLFISWGGMPANADAKPSWLEQWAARKSLHATIEREASGLSNPVEATDENIVAGVKLYAAHCAVCHGSSDAKPSSIAKGLFQKAPQLAKHGVEDDPEGETYWKIDHGIRLTGMPSYRASLSERQVWQIALFLKRMDALPAVAQKYWKALPSQGASISILQD